jgi:AcrR family transcriptional regulator
MAERMAHKASLFRPGVGERASSSSFISPLPLKQQCFNLATLSLREQVEPGLLDATVDVLAAEGWERLSLERIAQRAGTSRVTLWRQGVTRDTLIDALLERLTDDYRHSLWPILTAPGSGRERLEAALRALCEVADRHLQLLLTSDTAFHEAQARARRRPSFIEPLVRLLHDGVADGSVREPPDYQDRANALFNTVCWSFVHLRGKHGWSARRASSQVLDLVLNGVG